MDIQIFIFISHTGFNIFHSFVNILVIYAVLSVNRTKWGVLFAFVFNLVSFIIFFIKLLHGNDLIN